MRLDRALPMLAGLLALGLPLAHAQRAQTTAGEKLHPQMTRLLHERGPIKGWVYFRDKGLVDESALRQGLQAATEQLTPRALERRAARRKKPGLVDVADIPVVRSYVDQVLRSGVELSVESRWMNAVSVFGTRQQFRAIAELPFVDRVEPVRRGRLIDAAEDVTSVASDEVLNATASFYGDSFEQLDQINVVRLHDRGFTGKGVVIGILDTGFKRAHEAFNYPGHEIDVIAEYDFVDDDGNTSEEVGDPSGQHSHGTYILGVLGAYLPGELMGGAYDASFILAKTEDTTDEYEQEEDFYVAGIEFIESNGGDLATSSLGYIDWYTQSDLDGLTAVTTICVNNATDNGMHFTTAAGNSGHDTDPMTSALIAPSDAFDVITSGAVDSSGVIAGFSSDGPSADGRVKPEVLSHGVSTWTVCSNTDVNCKTQVSGTSLSTPVLACALACITQAHPNWSVTHMRDRLFSTGNYFRANGTYDPDFVLGYGIIDADRAAFESDRIRLVPSDQLDQIPDGIK